MHRPARGSWKVAGFWETRCWPLQGAYGSSAQLHCSCASLTARSPGARLKKTSTRLLHGDRRAPLCPGYLPRNQTKLLSKLNTRRPHGPASRCPSCFAPLPASRCPARPSRSRRSPGLCPPGGPGHGGGSACGRAARADPAPRLELGAPRSRRSVGRCGSRRITAGPLGGCVASRSGCGQSGRAAGSERVGPEAAGRLVGSARRRGSGRGRAAVSGGSGVIRSVYGRGKQKRRRGRSVRARDLSLPTGCGRPSQHGTSPSRAARCVLARFISEMPRGAACGSSRAPPEVWSGSALGAVLSGFAFAGNGLKFSENARCFSSCLASVCEPAAPLCFCIAGGRSVPLNSAQNFSSGRRRGCTRCSAPVPAAAAAARGSALPPRAAPRRAAPPPPAAPRERSVWLAAFGVLSSARWPCCCLARCPAPINPNPKADSPFRMTNEAAPASDAGCLIGIAVLMALPLMCAYHSDLRVLVWRERKYHGSGSSKLFKLLTDAFCTRNLNSLELHAGFAQRCTRCCFKHLWEVVNKILKRGVGMLVWL